MRKILILIALILACLPLRGCTNDEGETEFDILDPGTEAQFLATENP